MTCAPGRRATVRAATVLAAGALAPSPAAAHAFAERYDLPLPLGFYLAGAAVAVALSFLGSFAFLAPGRTWRLHRDLPVPRGIARAARATLTGVATAILAMVLVIGLFGPDSPTRNFATVFIWVVWWVGFALFTALVIDLWTPANPVRAVIAGLVPRAAGGPRELPVGAGAMAVTGLLAISWLELVSDWSESPRAMALIVVIYLGLTLAAVSRWGAEPWFGTADPLARLFSTLGALAPLAVVPGGIRLRLPGSGLGGLDPGGWGAVFIVSLIAIVLFDGLSETPLWAGLLDWVTRSPDLRPHLIALREAGVDILKLLRSAGLMATVGAAVAAYGALCLAVWRAGGRTVPAGRIFSAFAASLLPIAVAYHLAHYVSYLALAGQLMLPILSDPLGLGWDLLGTATRRVQLGVIGAQDVWWIAAGALVAGHGLSVVVAHAAAGRLFPDRRRAILSQVPMMVFMVTLTAASLWILAQPIVA
ncbi:hypothetical protein M1105_15690 [Limibaculum sp. FT325]|uniref:hypothetical protein n=1 Tax=Thermohalobaculum sediminis TaxID=2939436 RepID=UPI0020BEAB7D|nr:hypothetical protein [Limibaculum sediminis]MCL5778422.1 hypothetical protein [Limibaculum sediminis]